MFGEEIASLKDISFDDLVRSANLRSTILDYTKTHFLLAEQPSGSFEKEYRDSEHEKIEAF
jgi:hypothetical protein